MEQERRLRNIQIDERTVLSLMGQWEPYGKIYRMYSDEIPEDAKLQRVFHDPYRRVFVFTFSHLTFEVIWEGMEAPMCSMITKVKEFTANAD